MTQNNNKEVQYIWHDGVRIREDQLISMAMCAGSFNVAEHYICSLLAHGVMHNLLDCINKVNKVRDFYGVAPIPSPKNNFTEKPLPRKIDIGDKLRKLYMKMTACEHEQLLCASLAALMANYPHLFKYKNQWQSIYLVVRDRLDYGLSQMEFLVMAANATPAGWPERLQISVSVVKNFCRGIRMAEADEAYYEMDYNPQREFCDIFWEVLMHQIMAGKYGGNTEFE